MITLKSIADQITADPTLRVAFVAHSFESADRFVSYLSECLPVRIVESRTKGRLCVRGWDHRHPTVWAVKTGGVLAGSRIDLLVWEYAEGRSRLSIQEDYVCRLTERGRQETFSWDHELTARSGLR